MGLGFPGSEANSVPTGVSIHLLGGNNRIRVTVSIKFSINFSYLMQTVFQLR